MCREFRLTTAVYNPLAGGLLTGKHRVASPLAGTRFDGNQVYRDRYWHEVNFAAVTELAQYCVRRGRHPRRFGDALAPAPFAVRLRDSRRIAVWNNSRRTSTPANGGSCPPKRPPPATACGSNCTA